MTELDRRIAYYEQRRQEKLAGKVHYIPFDDALPRLAKHVPGIIPGIGYLLYANSGIGKSKLFRFLFLQVPYDYIKAHPNSGITFKVILNALEESVEELIDSFVVNRIVRKYGISLSINDLNGFSPTPLSEHVLSIIKEEQAYFNDYANHIIIVNEGNPYGFYNKVREYASQHGTFYDTEGNPVADVRSGWSKYIPNNPNEIVICATDHLWLYGAESGLSKYDTIVRFSSHYCRQMMNLKFGYATVNIQQAESAKEKKEFTIKGQNIIEKLEPSLDSLGDIKVTQRDNLVIMALFSPYRYKIPEYRGYNIAKLKNRARFLFIQKYRRGREGLVDPLLFDGMAETFEEMPIPLSNGQESEELNRLYQRVDEMNRDAS